MCCVLTELTCENMTGNLHHTFLYDSQKGIHWWGIWYSAESNSKIPVAMAALLVEVRVLKVGGFRTRYIHCTYHVYIFFVYYANVCVRDKC